MQSVSSRIWTRVAMSISYDDNDYTTGTSDKDALNEFSSTKTGEHSRQVLKGIFVQCLHKILHQTKLDGKRRKKHLIHVHQRILLEAVFARNKSASRPPVFMLVRLGYSLTILETEKTTVLCEARLHTHKKTNDLEVPTQTPLVLAVLNSF